MRQLAGRGLSSAPMWAWGAIMRSWVRYLRSRESWASKSPKPGNNPHTVGWSQFDAGQMGTWPCLCFSLGTMSWPHNSTLLTPEWAVMKWTEPSPTLFSHVPWGLLFFGFFICLFVGSQSLEGAIVPASPTMVNFSKMETMSLPLDSTLL